MVAVGTPPMVTTGVKVIAPMAAGAVIVTVLLLLDARKPATWQLPVMAAVHASILASMRDATVLVVVLALVAADRISWPFTWMLLIEVLLEPERVRVAVAEVPLDPPMKMPG